MNFRKLLLHFNWAYISMKYWEGYYCKDHPNYAAFQDQLNKVNETRQELIKFVKEHSAKSSRTKRNRKSPRKHKHK